MSVGGAESTDVRTMRGRDYPAIRQFSIFAPNKLGELNTLMRLIETSNLRVCALAVADSNDCSIIRLVVSQPERAFEILTSGGYKFCEIDLLVVELPSRNQPIVSICSSLLKAEVNIHYCFPLMVRPYDRPALAFSVDNVELASQVLDGEGFIVLTERDLEE